MFDGSFSCDEVYPQLFQGSKIRGDKDLKTVRFLGIECVIDLEGGFDLDMPWLKSYVYWHFYDVPWLPDLNSLHNVASFVKEELSFNHHVLVHCTQGLNRSGLVCGRSMVLCGLSGLDAVARIQEKRAGALWNPVFTEYLQRLAAKEGL